MSDFTVNGQRPELEQHHDRRCLQHRHRRQRRQHGDDEHRRRRRVQDPDQRLPGGVRARRRRPAAGRHQERHAEFPRLRLLVRTALGVGRQHVFEQARDAGDPEAEDRAQRLRLHLRRAGRRSRVSTRTRRSCSSSGARNSSAAATRRRVRQTRVPTALERRGDFSQSVDSSGNPFPYIRDFSTGLPCSAADTRGCFQDGGVLGRIPANRLYAPGLAALSIFPAGEFLGRQRPELHEPGSGQPEAPRRAAAHGLPAHRQLADHRPLHEQPRKTSCRRTGRRGPATAATSSRRRRSSCTPARTTCSPRPAS